MKNNIYTEIIISLVLVVLAVLLLDKFHYWMPGMTAMAIIGLLFVVFTTFAIFVLREKAQDEREMSHRMVAGRVAFLVGSTILTLGIITQALDGRGVDAWLVLALIGMVLSKLIARIYADKKL